MKFLISQGQAIRSVFGRSLVTHLPISSPSVTPGAGLGRERDRHAEQQRRDQADDDRCDDRPQKQRRVAVALVAVGAHRPVEYRNRGFTIEISAEAVGAARLPAAAGALDAADRALAAAAPAGR